MELKEKEWFIQAPWGRICIVAWGDCSAPPVLVVHGQMDSAASFRPLLRLLPQRFYYIGMEFPGNGRSDSYPPGLMINLFDLVYPIEVVRKHFRWEKFVYLAHSMGASIGRFYQLAYPDRLSKVIEIDHISPSFSVQSNKFTEWYDRYFTGFFEKYDVYNAPKNSGPKYTWDQAIEKLVNERRLTPETARATLERFTEPAGGQYIRFTIDQRMKLITRPPFSPEQLRTLFTNMTTPTLAIVCKESEKRGFYNNIPSLLEENLANCYKVVKVEGHHDTFITNPIVMAPYISRFLLDGSEKAKL